MIVWTKSYRPFLMGGNVNGNIGADIAVGEKLPLGKGYFGYLLASPISGQTYVAEAETGAFIGSSIADVRKDVESADEAVMQTQLAWARDQMKHVDVLTPEQFWRMFRAKVKPA